MLRVATADNEVIEQRARSRALGALICVEGSKGSTNDDTHCILISLSRRQRRARTRHTDQTADFESNPCAVARPALSNDVVNSTKGLVGVVITNSSTFGTLHRVRHFSWWHVSFRVAAEVFQDDAIHWNT